MIKRRPGVSITERDQGLQSILCGQEVGAVALLLFPPTLSRTLQSVHEAWAAALHMVGEVLQHFVQLAVVAATEEGYP